MCSASSPSRRPSRRLIDSFFKDIGVHRRSGIGRGLPVDFTGNSGRHLLPTQRGRRAWRRPRFTSPAPTLFGGRRSPGASRWPALDGDDGALAARQTSPSNFRNAPRGTRARSSAAIRRDRRSGVHGLRDGRCLAMQDIFLRRANMNLDI